jgi:hypothetical protein
MKTPEQLVQECAANCGSAIALMFQEAGLHGFVPRALALGVGAAMAPVFRELLTRARVCRDAAESAITTQTPPIH